MLPDRSKRYAGLDGEIPRLRLAENWQLAIIAVIMGGLLTVIFPRKVLIENLYKQEHLDELTLSYIENLQRTDPANVDLTILLGRFKRGGLDIATLEKTLAPVFTQGDLRQRIEARVVLLDAYAGALDAAPEAAAPALRAALAALIEDARRDETPPHLALALAAAAFRIGRPDAGLDFLKRAAPDRPLELLRHYARDALGAGRHALAGEYFLLARRQAANRDEARQLFREGIGAYMAASLFQPAMEAAERDLGDLADDPETLRFLARAALAAGEPRRAAHFARRLVFRDGATGGEARP